VPLTPPEVPAGHAEQLKSRWASCGCDRPCKAPYRLPTGPGTASMEHTTADTMSQRERRLWSGPRLSKDEARRRGGSARAARSHDRDSLRDHQTRAPIVLSEGRGRSDRIAARWRTVGRTFTGVRSDLHSACHSDPHHGLVSRSCVLRSWYVPDGPSQLHRFSARMAKSDRRAPHSRSRPLTARSSRWAAAGLLQSNSTSTALPFGPLAGPFLRP